MKTQVITGIDQRLQEGTIPVFLLKTCKQMLLRFFEGFNHTLIVRGSNPCKFHRSVTVPELNLKYRRVEGVGL